MSFFRNSLSTLHTNEKLFFEKRSVIIDKNYKVGDLVKWYPIYALDQAEKVWMIKQVYSTDPLDCSYYDFEITDGNKTIKIVFDGFIPELFQDEMGVILDGYFENNIFYSDDMLVKHDNEYVSEDGETYDVENYSK